MIAHLLLTLAVAARTGDTTWCATPRPNEPLLLDAQFLPARGKDLPGPDSLYINLKHLTYLGIHKVPPDSISIIRDEALCRRLAKEQGPKARPVLIVRVGSFFLVDDQRSRDGPNAYWEVDMYDKNWEWVISYGEGA